MGNIEEIIERAEGIKNEVKPRANTADRVGGVLVDVAEFTKEAALSISDSVSKSIKNIETKQSSEDGGENVVTIEQVNGDKKIFVVRNGSKGSQGAQGEKGERGDKGDAFTFTDFTPEQLASLKGEKGDKGDKGDQGLQGLQGLQGAQGEQGLQGIQGVQGLKGDTGATGPKGDKGDPFTYNDFTSEEIESLKKPATDAANELNKYLDIVKLPVVEIPTSETTLEIDANKVYDITIGESLTLTLNAPTDLTVTNEYQGSFDTGSTAPTVTFPSNVIWADIPSVEANTHYEFNIRYTGGKYYGLIQAWNINTEEESV